MFRQAQQDIPLAEWHFRHVLSIRIATIIVVFFTIAWCLLQWMLQSEQQFMMEGLKRQFVQLEAALCAVIAACAFLHLIASGVAWLATRLQMRRHDRHAPHFGHGLPSR
ncbi:hypothetical protein [Herbaspirillum sp. ST 5-3]|uniref:hypothetical protein n=1 Tax=Oxalobacteraceae TaxID=75682 RepID=UPI0010A44B39|nr:hypothetical protein [Herbaspirillum sp. ST 5-3]